jgi:hypothetical protein
MKPYRKSKVTGVGVVDLGSKEACRYATGIAEGLNTS